jgi:adenine phosphoribosyltransferase
MLLDRHFVIFYFIRRTKMEEQIKALIRNVPNFPKKGINYKDITTFLQNGGALAELINMLADRYRDKGISIVVGIESRGFIFGTPLAVALGVGFIPIRKPGKLPHKTFSVDYDLEYGTDCIEMHQDAIVPGEKVVLVDDLLATGGTAEAALKMLKEAGADVYEACFVIELLQLKGRKKLTGTSVHSVVAY